jgi:hypothetical protein
MNSSLAVQEKTAAQLAVDHAKDAIDALVLKGDTSKLSIEQKTQYYNAVCQSVGLNPATRPFQFLNFNGKEVLYPDKNCAEQMRNLRGVSLSGPKFTFEGTMIICEITATMRNGRTDTDLGIVDTSGKDKSFSRGDAMLKAVTKAKRRVTFSITGLGFLNEISDAVDEGTHLSLDEIPLAQLHGVNYLSSSQFDILTELAKAAQLTPKAMGLYLLSKYPGRGRGEIPADDFDAIAADFSNEEIVSHWNNRATPDPRVSIE